MRALPLAGAICALALAAAGCGAGGNASEPSSRARPVRLTVAAPGDLDAVRSDRVEVRGTVHPSSATVMVAGRRAAVSGGSFSDEVQLEPGVNVIDVLASAGDARPALTAVRVRRLVTVIVPDVTGLSPSDASRALKGAGLGADVQREGGGLLDELLGGDPAVCTTDPQPGAQADAGSTVTVVVSRRC